MNKHALLFLLFFIHECLYSQTNNYSIFSNVQESDYHASYCTDPCCIYGGGYTLKFNDNSEETTIFIDLSLTGMEIGSYNITGVYSEAIMVFPMSIWGNTIELSITKPLRATHGDIYPVTIETNMPCNTGFYTSYHYYHIELVYSTEP